MARIRSIHPGQAIDDDFVEMSRDARLFCLLLRCETDDSGLFEWKPKTLKRLIFPDDDVNVADLLAEMVEHNQCIQVEIDGKPYGAIRNFQKYQKPKHPNHKVPAPDAVKAYVGEIVPECPRSVPEVGTHVPGMSPDVPETLHGEGVGEGVGVGEVNNSCANSAPVDAPPKRGCRIPENFEPNRQYAAEQGLSPEQITEEAENFRDYWQAKPGKAGVKLDWQATWRTWVRRSKNFKPPGRASPESGRDNVLKILAEREKARA